MGPERRLAILAEGQFGPHHGKTAMGVIRYGPDPVVAVIDSTNAGRNVREWLGDAPRFDIPIVASLDDGARPRPSRRRADGPADRDRADRRQAARPPGEAPSSTRSRPASTSSPASTRSSATIPSSPRRPRPPASRSSTTAGRRSREETAVGRRPRPRQARDPDRRHRLRHRQDERRPGAARAAADEPACRLGLRADRPDRDDDRRLGRRGRPASSATSATATCEWLVEQGEARGDWIIVEGQGSLDHPAYTPSRSALIHGCTPQAMVMVHKPGLAEHDWDHVPRAATSRSPPLPGFIRLHEQVAGARRPVARSSRVALNTSLYADDAEARRVIAETAAETGLPADDPVRFGAGARCGRRSGRRRGPRPVSRPAAVTSIAAWPLTSEARSVAVPYRDPFRIARGPRRATAMTTGRRRAPPSRLAGPRRLRRGLSRRLLRRDGRDDGRRPAAPARLDRSVAPRCRLRARPEAALEAVAAGFDAAIAHHGAAKCALDIALHDLVGKRLGLPLHRAARPVGRHPADRLHDRHRRAGDRRRPGRARRATSRRSRSRSAGRTTSRRSRRSGRSSTGRSGSTRTPAGSPDDGARPDPRPRPPRRRADRAALPGHRLDQLRWLQERSSCRSSPTRARSRSTTSTRSSASSTAST